VNTRVEREDSQDTTAGRAVNDDLVRRRTARPMNDKYFSQETLEVTIDRRAPEETEAEIDFLERVGELQAGASVLDVGCGAGRQSIALARRGHRVTGIDKSELFLETARNRAAAACVDVEFLNADARELDRTDRYDLAVSFYTAFGYHSDADNEEVLRRVSMALKVGGRFVLDVTNRDAIANTDHEVKIARTDELTVVKENWFDPVTSRRRLEWTYLRDDAVVHRASFDHRVYALHELIGMFHRQGLDVVGMYRDIDCTSFEVGARHIYLVGQRTEGTHGS